MAFTHADTAIAQATASVSTQSVTLSAAVSFGDVICILWGSPNNATDTITDNAPGGSNTYVVPSASVNHNAFAYAVVTRPSASGITITITGGGSGTRFTVADRFSVSGGQAVFGSNADSTGTGTSGNCGSISNVPANELLWGAQHTGTASATYTAGSSNAVSAVIGSQVGNTGGSGFSQYILSGAGGTESVTWSSNISVTVNLSSWEAYFTVVGARRLPLSVPRRRLSRAVVQLITGQPPPATPNREPPLPPRPRPPRRAVVQSITGRPPPAVPNREPPPGPRPRPPRRAFVQHVTGSPPPVVTLGTANREQLPPFRARPPQRAVVRSVTGSPPAAAAAVYRPQPFRLPSSRRPSRAVVQSIRPQPAPAVAVVPSGFQDRRPGYLKKRILLGI